MCKNCNENQIYYQLNHETMNINKIVGDYSSLVDNLYIFDDIKKAQKIRDYLDCNIRYN